MQLALAPDGLVPLVPVRSPRWTDRVGSEGGREGETPFLVLLSPKLLLSLPLGVLALCKVRLYLLPVRHLKRLERQLNSNVVIKIAK